jgi:uncharacterized membrane protein (DUF2068 family)
MPVFPHIDTAGFSPAERYVLAGILLAYALMMAIGAYQLWKRSKG